jgi:hypothetical protein
MSEPLVVRVLGFSVARGGTILITVKAGSYQGVDDTWRAEVLDGQTDLPLAGGEIQIVKVSEEKTTGNVTLTLQQVQANTRVRLLPP